MTRSVPICNRPWGVIPWILMCCPPAIAQGTAEASVVDGALSDSAWYDADRGQLVPVHVEPVVDDSLNRNSRWLPKAKRIAQQPATPNQPAGAGGGGGGGGGLLGSGLTISNLFGWMLLIAVVVVVAGAIIYALSKTEVDLTAARARQSMQSDGPDEQTIERMKHLPAELRRTDVNLRSEAERLMNAGQFDQAIILLFGHQLLLLDRVGMLRLNRGKTNRKYLREIRAADADVAQRLQGTVTAFERSYFGRHQISHQEFAGLWRSNQELEQAIELRRGAAA